MARSTRGNKYGQEADEHPRPHVDVPMSVFGDPFFTGRYDLVGQFVHHWCYCVWKKNPDFFLFCLTPEDMERAIALGWLTVKKGQPRMTGPDRDPGWLADMPREWWTYAIEAVGQDRVKIGRSIDPDGRLAELQKACPHRLALMGKVRGDVEQKLHSELSVHRISGEWFALNDVVLSALCVRKVVPR